jgi:hypothetical protein
MVGVLVGFCGVIAGFLVICFGGRSTERENGNHRTQEPYRLSPEWERRTFIVVGLAVILVSGFSLVDKLGIA